MTRRVERFEDLVAWQRARELAREIYSTCRNGPLSKDYALANQLTRAAGSTMANIAEGFDRHGPKEFHRFLSTANGSNAEVRSHLYLALDAGYLTESEFNRLKAMAEETGRIIAGLRAAVKRSITSSE